MKVRTEIVENTRQFDGYLQLVSKKYSKHKAFPYFFHNIKKAIDYACHNNNQQLWLLKLTDKDELLVHIVLFTDKRFTNRAFFGFFECAEQAQAFKLIWHGLKLLCNTQKIKNIAGPVNATTWHAYRVVKNSMDNAEPFISDLLTEDYYYQYFKKEKPANEILYYSGLRQSYDSIIRLTEQSYYDVGNKGIQIVKADTQNANQLNQIRTLSNDVFQENYGFVPLNSEEFETLYEPYKLNSFNSSTYVALKNNIVVGYCASVKDGNTMIVKTMAVDRQYRGIGLGNALVYKVHADARLNNIQSIYYALILAGNNIKYFPKDDARIIREYALFEYNLHH